MATLLLLGGCAETRYVRFKNVALAPSVYDEWFIVAGNQNVLVINHFEFMWVVSSSYRLLIEIDPALLQNGQDIVIPGPGARACLKRRQDGFMVEQTMEVSGNIHIYNVSDAELIATVKLRSSSQSWTYAGAATFETAAWPPPR